MALFYDFDHDQRYFVCYFILRYVAQGKGILQPHNLIDELENILGQEDHLKDGPFGEIIKSAQVFYVSTFFVFQAF